MDGKPNLYVSSKIAIFRSARYFGARIAETFLRLWHLNE